MGMQKPNMGLDFTPTYGSRDTAHVQHKLAWSIGIQPKMPLPDIARISKTTKPIKKKVQDNIETMKMY